MIFDGSYLVGLQASKVYLQISEQAFIKSEQQIVTATVESYVNAQLAQAQLDVLEKNLAVAQLNYADVTKLYENGLTEEENVEQLALSVASLKSAVYYNQNMVRITKNMLCYVMGVSLDKPIVLTSTLEVLSLRAQKQEHGALSVTQNIDYQIAQNDIRSKELLLKLERFKALPRISAFANSGYDGFGESFAFFSSEQEWYPRTTLGLNINFPVFTSFQGKTKKQQAKLELEKSIKQSEDIVQQLLLEEKSLRNEVTLHLKNLKTTSESLALAKSIEQKNQIKFKEGMVSSYTLRQAQAQLYQEQNDYLTAMQRLILAKAKLSLLLKPITLKNK
jgi:outer membrane protein TolC